MRIQSDSVLTSTAANLQPVADLLPEQFAQLDFDYLGDTLLELVYEPEEPQPFHVRIDLETVEACHSLEQAKLEYVWWLSELIANSQEPRP